MSKLNALIFLNTSSDGGCPTTNAPLRQNFRWERSFKGITVENPSSLDFSLAPGESRTLFNGERVLTQDGTTQYSIAPYAGQTSTYELSWTGGTNPTFRTSRASGADATTQVLVTTNGGVVTFTSSPGTFASFSGLIPGMILPVVITANHLGAIGNSVVLSGNGTSSLNLLISNWNTANPSNQITLTSGNGTQVPDAGTYASYTGTILGTSTPVTITANDLGTVGDLVILTGNGSSSINTLITNWNTANPSNQVTLTSGDGTQIPAGGIFASYTGTIAGTSTTVTLTALTAGTNGNSIALTGDGTSSIDTLVANWNINNQSNQLVLSSGNGAQIPSVLAVAALTGGVNPAQVNLTGGTYGDITLSGGTTSTPFNLISGGVVVGDFVTIGNLFNILNQGQWQIISLTATSFSVANSGGVAEGPITLGSGFNTQVDIYSAAGIQPGDVLDISGGFSPVSWGSYIVTLVTNDYVLFSSTVILPSETVTTEDIAFYYIAKSLIYLEASQTCNVTINGTLTNQVVPFDLGCCSGPCKPGILMLSSNIHTLEITNTSTATANLFLASVE